MHLNKKQILQLFTPILVAFVLFFFQDEILAFMHKKLPQYKININTDMNQKADKYLQISKDKDKYDIIIKNIKEREDSTLWISKNFIYKNKNRKKIEKNRKKYTWNLQAVFPQHNMAIINAKFVHKNSVINKAKVIKIKFDSVLLKTSKGLLWVHLFH